MDKPLAKRLGSAVKAARAARSLTQHDVAERAGLSAEFYARIERGQTFPSVPTFVRLVDALATSADALLGHSALALGGSEERQFRKDELPPELRRLVRRLRRAKPRTIRLLSLLAAALER